MGMTEAKLQTKFTKFLRDTWYLGSAAFELKIVKGKSFPFSRVQEHQINGLLKAKHGNHAYKLTDMSIGLKPYDCYVLSNSKAFVVLGFLKESIKGGYFVSACIIDIDAFVEESKNSARRSITYQRAVELSTFVAGF